MLEVALIDLIAAGLVYANRSTSPAGRPMPTRLSGADLIREATAVQPAPTGQLVARVAEDVWQSCRAVNLPGELAAPHIAVLADIVLAAQPGDGDQAMLRVQDEAPTHERIGALSRHLLANVEEHVADGVIDATVLHYLLESFLQSLCTARDLLEEIRPAMAVLLAPETTAASPQSAIMLGKIERAHALGIAVPILDIITVTLINTTRSADLRQADLLAAADDARKLEAALQALPDVAPAHGDVFSHLPDMYRNGRLVDCARVLGHTEEYVVKSSVETAAHSASHVGLASMLRTLRAWLAALDGSFAKAARHYSFAQRYISRADYETRWQFAKLEAHYYELSAFYKGDATGLENAARACTSALAAMPGEAQALTRANAQYRLAYVLFLLGEKEGQSDRFEVAAQLLGDAEAIFSRADGAADLLRRAKVLRAAALGRLGALNRNSALLETSAALLQSIIEEGADAAAVGDGEPSGIELGLRVRMALTLVDYADLEPGEELRLAAMRSIEAALPDLASHPTPCDQTGFVRCLLLARSHEALARWHGAKGVQDMAQEHLGLAAAQYAAAGFSRQDAGPPALPQQASEPPPSPASPDGGEATAA